MIRRFTWLAALTMTLGATLLSGCAARPGPAALSPVAPRDANARSAPASPTTRQIELLLATDRQPDPEHPGNYTNDRAATLSFARYVLSVPPGHKPSGTEWCSAKPVNPASCFATLEFTPLPADYFSTAPGPASPDPTGASDANATRRVFIFVHGYNTNFPEAVLRVAQLEADNPSADQSLLFAWPSDGNLSGYVADKDAVTFSRDHLAQLLTTLAENPRYGEITLAAHSMGCWLAMESLRQLRLTGRDDVIRRLDNVLLAAPDIDLDVFRAQAKVIGPLDPPLTVLASPDDRALQLSNRLGGDRERLGGLDVNDPRIQALADDYGIQLIDITSMAATDSLNHDKFIGAASALKTVLTPQKARNPLRKAGAFVLDAVAAALETPGRIGRAAANVAK